MLKSDFRYVLLSIFTHGLAHMLKTKWDYRILQISWNTLTTCRLRNIQNRYRAWKHHQPLQLVIRWNENCVLYLMKWILRGSNSISMHSNFECRERSGSGDILKILVPPAWRECWLDTCIEYCSSYKTVSLSRETEPLEFWKEDSLPPSALE